MRSLFPLHLLASGALAVLVSMSAPVQALTKLSSAGICHDESSTWFDRTKTFTAYADLQSCLAVGRLPGSAGGSAAGEARARPAGVTAAAGYDRELYGNWADADGDCQNTRHEVLPALSPVTLARNGCSVTHGRWNDPCSGRIFTNPRDLDIDHMVPLAWAHARGGPGWSEEERMRFANDPINLFAVEASVNREKGAKGPLEWLPPWIIAADM